MVVRYRRYPLPVHTRRVLLRVFPAGSGSARHSLQSIHHRRGRFRSRCDRRASCQRPRGSSHSDSAIPLLRPLLRLYLSYTFIGIKTRMRGSCESLIPLNVCKVTTFLSILQVFPLLFHFFW